MADDVSHFAEVKRRPHRVEGLLLLGMGLAGLVGVYVGCTPREPGVVESAVSRPLEPQVEVAPVAAACAEIEAEIARVLGPYDVELEVMSATGDPEQLRKETEPLRTCFHALGGAWVLMPEAVKLDRYPDGQLTNVQISFRPVYVHPEGTRIVGESLDVRHAPYLEEDEFNAAQFQITVRLVDYDNDGHPELVLTTKEKAHEFDAHKNDILTASNGRIHTYAPLEGIDIEAVEDVDQDGRPDVISISRHYPGVWCFEMYEIPVGLPPVLYHARDDGSFSHADDVARAFLRKECPAMPRRLVVPFDRESPSWDMQARQAVACARLLGANAEDLVQQIRSEWSRLPADAAEEACGTTLEQLIELARKDPIVSL